MIRDIKNFLFEMNLDESEAQVLLAVMQTGQATVSKIAQKVNLNRASVYDVLRRLALKGLVRRSIIKKIIRYEAIDPTNIVEKLNENKERIEEQIEKFKKLKLEINALYGKQFDQPSVSFYEGLAGVKNILWDTIEDMETKEILSYASADYLKIGFGQDFLDKYWKRRTERKIFSRGIIPKTAEAISLFTPEKNLKELRKVKFIGPEKCDFTNEIDIYADKISIISLDKDNLYGVIIKSKSIANTQGSIYELLWSFL